MVPLMFDPDTHMVRDTPFARFMRTELRDPLLFTYKHMRTGNWMLAAWIERPMFRMLELAVLGESPVGDKDIIDTVKSMVRGNSAGEARRKENRTAISYLESRAARQMNEDQDEVADARAFLQRKATDQTRQFSMSGLKD